MSTNLLVYRKFGAEYADYKCDVCGQFQRKDVTGASLIVARCKDCLWEPMWSKLKVVTYSRFTREWDKAVEF